MEPKANEENDKEEEKTNNYLINIFKSIIYTYTNIYLTLFNSFDRNASFVEFYILGCVVLCNDV
jgi:hypothetical protein